MIDWIRFRGRKTAEQQTSGLQGVTTPFRLDELYEPDFDRCLQSAVEHDPHLTADLIRYRIYNVCQLAHMSAGASGDMMFCGVSYGVAIRTLMMLYGPLFADRTISLVDSWQQESHAGTHDGYCDDNSSLRSHFRETPNVEFVVGLIPEALGGLTSRQFSFVHLNTGAIEAEAASLDFILDRMASGGVLLIDAYGSRRADTGSYFRLREADGTLMYFLSGQAAFFQH